MNLEFKNLPNYLLSDDTPCFLALGGHYFHSYIPEKYEFEKDYDLSQCQIQNIKIIWWELVIV